MPLIVGQWRVSFRASRAQAGAAAGRAARAIGERLQDRELTWMRLFLDGKCRFFAFGEFVAARMPFWSRCIGLADPDQRVALPRRTGLRSVTVHAILLISP